MAAVIVGTLIAATVAAADAPVPVSSCIACHAAIPQDPKWQHSYEDWQDSLHANSNVDCHSCHGGDNRAATAAKAHAGMVPVGGGKSPKDRLLAVRVCGSCHPDQYWAFTHSLHYQRLVDGKLAAYCHTCHTSVGSRVLTPQTIAATCSRCHRNSTPGSIPDEATTLLTELYRVRMALAFRDPESNISPEQWHAINEAAIAAMAAWHEFDLTSVGRALAYGTGVLER